MAHYNKNVWLKFHSFVVIVWQNLRFFGNFYLHCIMQMLISHEVIVYVVLDFYLLCIKYVF